MVFALRGAEDLGEVCCVTLALRPWQEVSMKAVDGGGVYSKHHLAFAKDHGVKSGFRKGLCYCMSNDVFASRCICIPMAYVRRF
jgi:hypothetical protein